MFYNGKIDNQLETKSIPLGKTFCPLRVQEYPLGSPFPLLATRSITGVKLQFNPAKDMLDLIKPQRGC